VRKLCRTDIGILTITKIVGFTFHPQMNWHSEETMKFKPFATDDWLARHPKVMAAISVILFIALCYMESTP
jgi:hypothetical protein